MQNNVISFLLTLIVLLNTNIESYGQQTDDSLCYMLLTAAYDGDLIQVKSLLDSTEVYIDCHKYFEPTALLYAIDQEHDSLVLLLLQYGADPDFHPYPQPTPINLAVKNYRFITAENLIIYGANINIAGYAMYFPLQNAVINRDFLMSDMLLHYGASPNIKFTDESTPLHIAAWNGDTLIISTLVYHNATIDAKDKNGFTPLMIAAQNGNLPAVKTLIENGALIYATNSYKQSAIELAIANKHDNVLDYLLNQHDSINTLLPDILSLSWHQNSKAIKNIVEKHTEQEKRIFLPLVNSWSLGYGFNFSGRETMFLYEAAIHDIKYKTSAVIGFQHRYSPATVIQPKHEDPNIEYQLPSYRSFLYGGLEKHVPVKVKTNMLISLTGGINGGYTFGRFLGTAMTPGQAFIGTLKTGVSFHTGQVSAGIHYLWMKMPETNIKPHRLGFVMRISFVKKKYKIKKYYLPYEVKTY
ncbi:MAG: ankyrin repeat domain-containing protein [Bacteroidales bacterium]|nr:ankyrin repeat domain-containing protein [Bacteroidales bacterium]